MFRRMGTGSECGRSDPRTAWTEGARQRRAAAAAGAARTGRGRGIPGWRAGRYGRGWYVEVEVRDGGDRGSSPAVQFAAEDVASAQVAPSSGAAARHVSRGRQGARKRAAAGGRQGGDDGLLACWTGGAQRRRVAGWGMEMEQSGDGRGSAHGSWAAALGRSDLGAAPNFGFDLPSSSPPEPRPRRSARTRTEPTACHSDNRRSAFDSLPMRTPRGWRRAHGAGCRATAGDARR